MSAAFHPSFTRTICLILLNLVPPLIAADTDLTYTFEQDELSPNFRPIEGTTPPVLHRTGGWLQGTINNNGHQAVIFRPGGKQKKVTDFVVEAVVGVQNAGAGFGIYFGGGSDREKLWVFLQIDDGPEGERLRYFTQRDATAGGSGGALVSEAREKSSVTKGRWFHVEFSVKVISTSQIDLLVTLWDDDSKPKQAPVFRHRQSLVNLARTDTQPGEVGLSLFRNAASGPANVFVNAISLVAPDRVR